MYDCISWRKRMRQEKTAIVNVYKLSEEWENFKVLFFEKENEKWYIIEKAEQLIQ